MTPEQLENHRKRQQGISLMCCAFGLCPWLWMLSAELAIAISAPVFVAGVIRYVDGEETNPR